MTALTNIQDKVRRLTARPSQNDLSNADLNAYINTYYQYDMPESMRFLELRDTWSFTTVGNQETYPFPRQQYLTVEPPAYVGGQQVNFFNNDRDSFYREWPKNNYIQQVALGNGTAGPYTGQISATPFMPSTTPNPPLVNSADTDFNVMLSAQTNTSTSALGSATSAYDNGVGGLVDTTTFNLLAGSSINYMTGNFTVNFSSIVPQNNPIFASVIPYQSGMPRAILIAQETIYMRPIPDKAYLVDITVERQPTALLNATDTPFNYEWWQLIAFGAAAKILEDNADWEQRQAIEPFFAQQLLLMQRRTLNQLTTSRTQTIYTDNGQGNGCGYDGLYPYI